MAGGGLLGWLPVSQAILLVGGIIGGLLLMWQPVLVVYLLIPTIPFSPLMTVSIAGFGIGLMELLVLAALGILILQHLVEPDRYTLRGSLAVAIFVGPLLIFLGGVLLSWTETFSLRASLIETAKWIMMLWLYIFVIQHVTYRQLKYLLLLIILSGCAEALLGLYQFIFRIGPDGFLLFGGRFLRAYGTFGQPNPYAGYLGLCLPLAVTLSYWAIFQWRNEDSRSQTITNLTQPRLLAIGLMGAVGLMGLAVLASQSRSGLLAMLTAVTVSLAILSRPLRVGFLLMGALGLLLTFGGVASVDLLQADVTGRQTLYQTVLQRVVDATAIFRIEDVATTEVTVSNFATLERLAHWQAAWDMWRDNFWLGVGFGNYEVVYPAYYVGPWEDPLGHAHNYLFNLGAEVGLIGLTAYLICWLLIFGIIGQAIWRTQDPFKQAVFVGGLGVMLHLHTHNLFDNLYVQGMYLHVAIVLALISIGMNNDK